MMKLCGKTIPELAEQIKVFAAEAIEKQSGEYSFIIDGNDELPVYIDVQRNESAKMSKLQIKLGLISLGTAMAHYSVAGKKHKDNASELKEIKSIIDSNIWTVVNIILLADSRFSDQIQKLFAERSVPRIYSDIYGISIHYHCNSDSQQFMIADKSGNPIYALEEAYTPLINGFITTVESLKSLIFKVMLSTIKQDSFEFNGKIESAHSKETSGADQ